VEAARTAPDPLPEDPTLAEVASAMRDATHWATIVDARWQIVYTTDDLRLASGFMIEPAPSRVGLHMFSTEILNLSASGPASELTVESAREHLATFGGWVLEDTPGGPDALKAVIDPRLHDIVDQLGTPGQSMALSGTYAGYGVGGNRPTLDLTGIRLRDANGRLAGTALIQKPHHSMSMLAILGAQGDAQHFTRMQSVASAGRRPAAILFADLEASAPLARRLSTANYFALGRRMARAADKCIIDAGGMTGRHVGDGVVAFFIAEHFGSESGAASACITAARALTAAMEEVASHSDLAREDLTMRYGLHWGATLYVGQISTVGRTEITALGDEVNEGARIEACATGGRTLASKHLIERLDPEAASTLGVDLDHITYTQLGDLSTATDKARRDAPPIAVCSI
jgi:class 3 adenylate cyclase